MKMHPERLFLLSPAKDPMEKFPCKNREEYLPLQVLAPERTTNEQLSSFQTAWLTILFPLQKLKIFPDTSGEE
jgi:hypothetical protein